MQDPATDIFTPIAVGDAMKIIFERNMKLGLDEVANHSSIPLDKVLAIASGAAPLDKGTAGKLKTAFGDTATTLYRMQVANDYHAAHGQQPPQDLILNVDI